MNQPTDIPPADVEVTTDNPSVTHHRCTVVIRRPGANAGIDRVITGEGETPSEAIRDSYKRFLDDPRNGEFLASRRK